MNSNKLREIILNTRQPIVFKQFEGAWECKLNSLDDWCKQFDKATGGAELEFERMPIHSTTVPQWERKRECLKMTMEKFLNEHQHEDNYWSALNYKTPDEIPEQCKNGIDFSAFGFPYITDDYARFWLSSKGANTPCHKDTYGCNIVCQIFGSKLWVLFSPATDLTSTRLPYEESSIYCLENLYAPSSKELLKLKDFEAYICHLEPGDVLCVPRHWWHFVETECTSLSVNAWVPLEIDKEAQLEECVVQYLMTMFAKGSDTVSRHYMLNPNQRDLTNEIDILKILDFLSQNTEVAEPIEKCNKVTYKYQYLDDQEVSKLLKDFPTACYVKKANKCIYEGFLKCNAMRLQSGFLESEQSPLNIVKELFINSLCNEQVVKMIVKEFQTRYNRI